MTPNELGYIFNTRFIIKHNMPSTIKTFIVLFLFQINTFPQLLKNIGEDVVHFGNTGKGLWSSFTALDAETKIAFGASAAFIGAGYLFDEQIKSFSQKNKSKFGNSLFSLDEYYGSKWTLVAVSAYYGYGLLFNYDSHQKTELKVLESVIYASSITSVIKSISGRSRPFTNKGKSEFQPIKFTAPETSFPSGHTTLAFAISTTLAEHTESMPLKIGLYSTAVLVGAARVYNNAHWFSDVVGGGLIGYFVGKYIANRDENKESVSVMIFPLHNNFIHFIFSL